jgi:hypothetical protein
VQWPNARSIKKICIYLFIINFSIQLGAVLQAFDKDDKIACIVLTGSTRAFAGKYNFFFVDKSINFEY